MRLDMDEVQISTEQALKLARAIYCDIAEYIALHPSEHQKFILEDSSNERTKNQVTHRSEEL